MSMARSTEISGFLDGQEYTASFLYEFFALLVGNGVYANELAPTATNDNMTVTYGSGHAWINGVLYKNTTPFNMDFDTADGALNRYDSIMLRLDLSQNEVYAVVEKGVFATSPTPPEVTRNAETFDLKICDVYIPAGCTKITQDQIIDTRLDSSVCGIPMFPVEHLDMATFYRQINTDLKNFKQKEQTDFAAWTKTQKDEILNLLRQLNNLVETDTAGELITEINKKLSKSGDDMDGPINMNKHSLIGLKDPTEETEATPKGYVDKQRPELIWENASPSSAFPAQDISLDLSGYIAVIIYTQWGSFRTEVGGTYLSSTFSFGDTWKTAYCREYRVKTNRVSVYDCMYSHLTNINPGYSTDNTIGKPLKIYGIKG